MIASHPHSRPHVSKVVQQLDQRVDINRTEELARGIYGPVYSGSFGQAKVAVKRILLKDVPADEHLFQLKHGNIVAILHMEDEKDFRYSCNNIDIYVYALFIVCAFLYLDITP